ncbi:MAG: hypothetical protein ABW118_09155 [Candidatus Thiodiazotropha sp.]
MNYDGDLASFWREFALKAWKAGNQPIELHPDRIIDDPLHFDQNFYAFLEEILKSHYTEIIAAVESSLDEISKELSWFVDQWWASFEGSTVWKQLLPFLVMSRANDGWREEHTKWAAAFVIGQAIPSVVVDQMLDEDTECSPESVAIFCLGATSVASKILAGAPRGELGNLTLSEHSLEMYVRMHSEWMSRYCLPDEVTTTTLKNYLIGSSPLMASVFFGIGFRWAWVILGKKVPLEVIEAGRMMRRGRQLSDELADFPIDIRRGVVSYPLLHALQGKAGQEIRSAVENLWTGKNDQPISLNREIRFDYFFELVVSSGGMEAGAEMARELTHKAGLLLSSVYRPLEARELVLLVNIRLARLNRLEDNSWHEIPQAKIHQPSISIHQNL